MPSPIQIPQPAATKAALSTSAPAVTPSEKSTYFFARRASSRGTDARSPSAVPGALRLLRHSYTHDAHTCTSTSAGQSVATLRSARRARTSASRAGTPVSASGGSMRQLGGSSGGSGTVVAVRSDA
jgi:uncharacterized membrane protein YgcG